MAQRDMLYLSLFTGHIIRESWLDRTDIITASAKSVDDVFDPDRLHHESYDIDSAVLRRDRSYGIIDKIMRQGHIGSEYIKNPAVILAYA
jgi:hypothetical protein